MTELHGWALGRAVELLHDDRRSTTRCAAALDDELVAALLLGHGHAPGAARRSRRTGPRGVRARRSARARRRVELVEASEADGTVRLLDQRRRRHAALADPADRRAGAARAGRRRRRPGDRGCRRRAAGHAGADDHPADVDRAAAYGALDRAPGGGRARRRSTSLQLVRRRRAARRLPASATTCSWRRDPFTDQHRCGSSPPTRRPSRPATGLAPRAHDPFPTHVDGGVVEVLLDEPSCSGSLTPLRAEASLDMAGVSLSMHDVPSTRWPACGRPSSGGWTCAPGSAARCAARPIGADHRHVVDTTERTLQVPVPATASCCSPTPAASDGRYRQVPARYAALDADGIDDAAWDALAIPVCAGVLLPQLGPRSRRSPSTRARPAPPSRCCRSRRGRPCSTRNPAFAATAPDVEAVIVRRTARRQRVLRRPHRCLLRARRAAADALDAASTAAPRRTPRSTDFFERARGSGSDRR